MTDPVTPNVGFAIPTRGSDVGVWDTPVNNNMTIADLMVGGTATIGLNNANVVLSAAQFQAEQITFNSTLTGSVTITFPTSFTKSYVIKNACTGSSAFTVTLATTAGGQVIGCPPGELFECRNDGANINFKNFGRIGEYMDYAGSSTPNWSDACNPQRAYLACDGGASISSGTYPVLFGLLGANTPDFRGRVAGYLNQGSGRITAGGGGVDGNTIKSGGGAETNTIANNNLPALIPYTDAGHAHPPGAGMIQFVGTGAPAGTDIGGGANSARGNQTGSAVTGIQINPGGLNLPITNLPPMAIAGLRLIRAG